MLPPTELTRIQAYNVPAHGGGFMFGDLDSEDPFCRVVSERTKTAVINVDYRLSPEHKWPVQLNDTLTVYKWALANAARYNLDPNRFYTIGGSAGGLLALATANQIIRDPQLKSSLKGIAALVPATTHWNNIPSSYKSMHKSFKENARYVPVNDKESLEIFYREVGLDPRDSSCFTILAEDQHKNFPPTYFVSCEYDPLRDDAFVMEEALNEAGVRTKVSVIVMDCIDLKRWLTRSLCESMIIIRVSHTTSGSFQVCHKVKFSLKILSMA